MILFVSLTTRESFVAVPLTGKAPEKTAIFKMSDEISKTHLRKLQREIKVAEPDFRYAARSDIPSIVCAIKIPYPLLKMWNDIKKGKVSCQQSSDEQDQDQLLSQPVSVATDVPYIDLLEQCIPGNLFVFSDNPDIRTNVDNNLSKIAEIVANLYKRARGRSRKQLDGCFRRFNIFEGQTMSIEKVEADVERIKSELESWRAKYENLEKAKEELYNEMRKEIEIRDTLITEQTIMNKDLQDYILLLEKNEGIAYGGKPISEVANKSRSLKQYLSRVQSALWFSKNFGLEVKSLQVQESNTGIEHEIKIHNSVAENLCTSTKPQVKFSSLPADEKEKIEQILFLLDKFCVGDQFFHELTMIVNGLPKSYLVKQLRSELNKICHLEQLPGMHRGVKVSSLEDLLKNHIADLLGQKPETDHVQIKFSGDGARMTRKSNYTLLSFSILQSGESVMSAKGNRTIAVVNGPEEFEVIKTAFQDIFTEINNLISQGYIVINGEKIKTEIFLGGDYKFILMILGLKTATSNYSCAWCKLHKDDRWNMEFDLEYFNSDPIKRTIQEIKEMSKRKHDNYCCAHYPLLDIELDHVITDELHLLLRITDVLTSNLVDEVLTWDQEDDFKKTNKDIKGKHLKKLIETIQSCGVTFDVWPKKNADGKESGLYDYTSLLGSDKKLLLAELPDKLNDVLRPSTKNTVIQVWKEFANCYKIISSWEPNCNYNELWEKAKSWINLFLSLNGKREGYERHRVTPYMHIMVAHCPIFLKQHKSVKTFSGQGVEKNNDVARSVVLRKSNKYDAVGDVLRVEHRQWELRMRQREARKYEKRNEKYWTEEIKVVRKKQKPIAMTNDNQETLHTSQPTEQHIPRLTLDPKSMNLEELKQELKKRGVHGYSRKRKAALIELLENELEELH